MGDPTVKECMVVEKRCTFKKTNRVTIGVKSTERRISRNLTIKLYEKILRVCRDGPKSEYQVKENV